MRALALNVMENSFASLFSSHLSFFLRLPRLNFEVYDTRMEGKHFISMEIGLFEVWNQIMLVDGSIKVHV